MPNNIAPTLAVTPSGCGKNFFIKARTEVHTHVFSCFTLKNYCFQQLVTKFGGGCFAIVVIK